MITSWTYDVMREGHLYFLALLDIAPGSLLSGHLAVSLVSVYLKQRNS